MQSPTLTDSPSASISPLQTKGILNPCHSFLFIALVYKFLFTITPTLDQAPFHGCITCLECQEYSINNCKDSETNYHQGGGFSVSGPTTCLVWQAFWWLSSTKPWVWGLSGWGTIRNPQAACKSSLVSVCSYYAHCLASLKLQPLYLVIDTRVKNILLRKNQVLSKTKERLFKSMF